jgi:GT2 family glycosyltransferase
MTDCLVSVVIVSWDGLAYLEDCLPSVERSLARVPGPSEIWVVDNGSTDGTLEFLADHHPDVRVIANEENRGFSIANNQAFAQARGRYVATLNNDTVVDPDWLVEAIRELERHPDVGSVACQLVFRDRPSVINSAGVSVDRRLRVQDRSAGAPADAPDAAPVEVFGPSAGAAVYRAEVLRDLGGFEESFFAYFEDVDLAWRARRSGWRSRYVPAALVHHTYSGTSRRNKSTKAFLMARNRSWLLLRNASWGQLLVALPHVLLFDLGTAAVALVRERSTAPLRGKLALLRGGGGITRTRRALPYLPSTALAEPEQLRDLLSARLERDRLMGAAA